MFPVSVSHRMNDSTCPLHYPALSCGCVNRRGGCHVRQEHRWLAPERVVSWPARPLPRNGGIIGQLEPGHELPDAGQGSPQGTGLHLCLADRYTIPKMQDFRRGGLPWALTSRFVRHEVVLSSLTVPDIPVKRRQAVSTWALQMVACLVLTPRPRLTGWTLVYPTQCRRKTLAHQQPNRSPTRRTPWCAPSISLTATSARSRSKSPRPSRAPRLLLTPTASGAFRYRVAARSRTAPAAADATPLHVPTFPTPRGVPTLPSAKP
jgi:hypothetical protein